MTTSTPSATVGGESGLDLAALHVANETRQREWCAGGDASPDLAFRGNELAGETGEACNVIKKMERERHGWRGSRATMGDLAEELADVVICADLCAVTAGIDLSAAVVSKFNATSEKQGLSTKLAPAPATAGAEDLRDDNVERVARALFEADEDLTDQSAARLRREGQNVAADILSERARWDDPRNAPILDAFRFRARAAILAARPQAPDAPAGDVEAMPTYARRLFIKAADDRCVALKNLGEVRCRTAVNKRDYGLDEAERKLEAANAHYEAARNELLADIDRTHVLATPPVSAVPPARVIEGLDREATLDRLTDAALLGEYYDCEPDAYNQGEAGFLTSIRRDYPEHVDTAEAIARRSLKVLALQPTTRHATADVEALRLLQASFLTCRSIPGDTEVRGEIVAKFETLKEAQDAHRAIVRTPSPTPPAPEGDRGDNIAERCFVCLVPFKSGDRVLSDVNEGPMHAACCGPERESYVGDDGEPLKPGEPIPQGYLWKPWPEGDQGGVGEAVEAVKNCANAVAFFDHVKTASAEEQAAVGSDHWNWLESACRRAAHAGAGWPAPQPMETAPKDRMILSTNRYGAVWPIMWANVVLAERTDADAWDDGERDEDQCFVPYEPKCWWPLPEVSNPAPTPVTQSGGAQS